jgi:hypothetical protein
LARSLYTNLTDFHIDIELIAQNQGNIKDAGDICCSIVKKDEKKAGKSGENHYNRGL